MHRGKCTCLLSIWKLLYRRTVLPWLRFGHRRLQIGLSQPRYCVLIIGDGGGEANTETCCTGNVGKALDWLNQSDWLVTWIRALSLRLIRVTTWYRSSKQTTGEKNTDTWGFWQQQLNSPLLYLTTVISRKKLSVTGTTHCTSGITLQRQTNCDACVPEADVGECLPKTKNKTKNNNWEDKKRKIKTD